MHTQSSILERIPSPIEVKELLAKNRREASFLRQLLKAAESKRELGDRKGIESARAVHA